MEPSPTPAISVNPPSTSHFALEIRNSGSNSLELRAPGFEPWAPQSSRKGRLVPLGPAQIGDLHENEPPGAGARGFGSPYGSRSPESP